MKRCAASIGTPNGQNNPASPKQMTERKNPEICIVGRREAYGPRLYFSLNSASAAALPQTQPVEESEAEGML